MLFFYLYIRKYPPESHWKIVKYTIESYLFIFK